jgi:hypothetical protein
MKCNDYQARFDDFLDGLLNSAGEEEVRTHLVKCEECAAEIEAIRKLRDLAAELPRALEPPNDLWPEIVDRIEDQKVVRGVFVRRALVAAAAVLVLVGSVVTAYFLGRQQVTPVNDMRAMAGPGPSSSALASFEGLGVDDYEANRTMLLDAVEARRNEISAETLEEVMVNLRVIDDAMERICEALGESPDDARLMRQLAAVYRQQIDLLQQAARLPAEV